MNGRAKVTTSHSKFCVETARKKCKELQRLDRDGEFYMMTPPCKFRYRDGQVYMSVRRKGEEVTDDSMRRWKPFILWAGQLKDIPDWIFR